MIDTGHGTAYCETNHVMACHTTSAVQAYDPVTATKKKEQNHAHKKQNRRVAPAAQAAHSAEADACCEINLCNQGRPRDASWRNRLKIMALDLAPAKNCATPMSTNLAVINHRHCALSLELPLRTARTSPRPCRESSPARPCSQQSLKTLAALHKQVWRSPTISARILATRPATLS